MKSRSFRLPYHFLYCFYTIYESRVLSKETEKDENKRREKECKCMCKVSPYQNLVHLPVYRSTHSTISTIIIKISILNNKLGPVNPLSPSLLIHTILLSVFERDTYDITYFDNDYDNYY